MPRDVVVVDTNVLLRHGGRLEQINWHDPLKAWPHEPIMLGVPLVVVEELDKLKTATGKMDVDDIEVPVEERARVALKLIDQWFGDGDARGTIHAKTPDRRLGDVEIQLIADDLRHERLSNNDSEIIAQAIGLQPFTAKLALASGDRAMRFRSQQAGLLAFDPMLGRA